jgi:hypothetical protein
MTTKVQTFRTPLAARLPAKTRAAFGPARAG